MRTRIFALCLITYALFLYSCSSNTADTKTSRDTSSNGLTDTIEKNPPVENGDYVAKYPNGIIKMKGFYIKGKREGQWSSFFENGKLQSEGFFKNGLRDGKAIVYFKNGRIYYTGYYKDGKEVGKWEFFNMQGEKMGHTQKLGSMHIRRIIFQV
jgi:antitoxin component YwqK of YwqJK toxin-antitoxin module